MKMERPSIQPYSSKATYGAQSVLPDADAQGDEGCQKQDPYDVVLELLFDEQTQRLCLDDPRLVGSISIYS